MLFILRIIVLWMCGLFACSLTGGMIAHYFLGTVMDSFGGFVGAAAFACVRLWTTEKRGGF